MGLVFVTAHRLPLAAGAWGLPAVTSLVGGAGSRGAGSAAAGAWGLPAVTSLVGGVGSRGAGSAAAGTWGLPAVTSRVGAQALGERARQLQEPGVSLR